jgi:hypothetical protein
VETPGENTVDEDTLSRMRAMGYVGS